MTATQTLEAPDFTIGPDTVERLYQSGRAAATAFLERWSFEDYLERCRRGAAGSVPR